VILTGLPLFMSEAIKYYYNPFFLIKISTLIIVIAFTITIKKKTIMALENLNVSVRIKLIGLFL
tara:strand:+ start:303 stop:494 length:192 start_codon:yes stop_codon:yes gene_type:complete